MLESLQLIPVIPLWGIFAYHVYPKLKTPMKWGGSMGLDNCTSLAVTIAEVSIVILLPLALILMFIQKTQIIGTALFICALIVAFIIMLGAIIIVHGKKGWNVMEGGMEFHILALFVCVQLIISSYLITAPKF